MIKELRLLIAETLLRWVLKIAPKDDKDGNNMRIKIAEYFDSVLFKSK